MKIRPRPAPGRPGSNRQAGFTLVEVVVAMALLAAIMAMLYSGLTFALRSWDAGDANGRRVADRRLGENFLRRELTEMFPMRWKDATAVKFAFEGESDRLRFVSSRPAGLQQGGLSLVGLEVGDSGPGSSGPRARNLLMRRAMPDDEAVSFAPLEKVDPVLLIANVDSIKLYYFGAEGDFAEARWSDSWPHKAHLPLLVKLRVTMADGRVLPDFVIRVVLGVEAGCLESSFQRGCRPRRPS
jgi:general secretion pathway protein J